jgi:Squalene/phytoene synthase
VGATNRAWGASPSTGSCNFRYAVAVQKNAVLSSHRMNCPIADVRNALERFGPDRCDAVGESEARAWCRQLAWGHYENFSVLSSIVPSNVRDDFGAVYAFCRWADDLGDEIGDRARATALLGWWREELRACFAGSARHPVMVALSATVRRHELPYELFDRLIRAFEVERGTRLLQGQRRPGRTPGPDDAGRAAQ